MRRVAGLVTVVAVVAAILVVAPLAQPSGAAITCEKTWAATGSGTTGVWEDPGVLDHLETQWSPMGVPSLGDSVCLPGGNYTVVLLGPAAAEDLRIGDNLGGLQPTMAIRGTSAGQALTLVATGSTGVENYGTLRLGHPTVSTETAVSFGTQFVNQGTVELIQGGGGTRTIHGVSTGSFVNTGTLRSSSNQGLLSCLTLTSTGVIDVDNGAQLGTGACGGVHLVVNGGSVVNDGLLVASSSLAANGNAAITGANPIRADGGPLSFSGSPSGRVQVWESSIAGTIPEDIEIIFDDPDPGSTAFLSLSGPVTNEGTLRLTGADLGAAFIVVGTHTFTNNGEVHFEQGADGDRGISGTHPGGRFVNNGLLHSASDETRWGCITLRNNSSGVIDVDPGAWFATSTCEDSFLELRGGEVRNDGIFSARPSVEIGGDVELPTQNPLQMRGTLRFLAGSTASGDVHVLPDNTDLPAGTIPADITVTIDSRFSPAVLRATGAVTNKGTIRLTGTDTPDESALLFPGRTFTNDGTIELLPGVGGARRLGGSPGGGNAGTLQNNGTVRVATALGRNGCGTTVNNSTGVIDVDAGATWATTCGTHTMNVNGGTVEVAGTVAASPLSINAGVVTGTGTITGAVTNSGGIVAPGASVGTLDVNGSYTQSANGRLEIETEPSGGSATVDLLEVTGNATLGGTVVVDAAAVVSTATSFVTATGTRTGTFADVRGVPDAWVSYNANAARVQSVVTFPDVPLSHPFFLDVAWAAGEGTVNGFNDGTFKPGNTASRQAVVAMLYRLAEATNNPAPGCSSAPFPDVPANAPFCGEITWAADLGLVNGFSDGTFKPGNTITRQALMAIIYRLAGSPNGATPTCTSAPFPDVPTNAPFCGEISWAKGEGLANGFSDGTFKPGNTLSRQAIAAFLHRFAVADLLSPF